MQLDILTLPKVLSKTGELEWQKFEEEEMSGSRRFKNIASNFL